MLLIFWQTPNPYTLATWWEELTHWKRPWCWERLLAGGEGDNRGWDGCMASPIWWTWVWASSGSWWWTGKSGVLQSMRSQGVGHNWVTELKPIANVSAVFPEYILLILSLYKFLLLLAICIPTLTSSYPTSEMSFLCLQTGLGNLSLCSHNTLYLSSALATLNYKCCFLL